MEHEDISSDENIKDNEQERATDMLKKAKSKCMNRNFVMYSLYKFQGLITLKKKTNNRSVPFCKVGEEKLSC